MGRVERHTGPPLVARYPGYRSLVFGSSALHQMRDTCPLVWKDTVFSSFVLWGQFPLLHLPLLSAGCRFQWAANPVGCQVWTSETESPPPPALLPPFFPSFLPSSPSFGPWGSGRFLKSFFGEVVLYFVFKLVEKLQE